MEDLFPFPEYSKEDLDIAFEEAFAAVEHLHNKLASAAEEAGYVKNIIHLTKPTFEDLYKRAQDDPSVYPMIASGIDFLRGMGNELNRLAGSANEFTISINPITNSTKTQRRSTSPSTTTPQQFWKLYSATPIRLGCRVSLRTIFAEPMPHSHLRMGLNLFRYN